MIGLLLAIAQGLFVLILVGMLAWLLGQPLPQGDDDPDQFQRAWRAERASREEVLASALTDAEYQPLTRRGCLEVASTSCWICSQERIVVAMGYSFLPQNSLSSSPDRLVCGPIPSETPKGYGES